MMLFCSEGKRPDFQHGYDDADNVFNSLDLALWLAEEKCSVVGTMWQQDRTPRSSKKEKGSSEGRCVLA